MLRIRIEVILSREEETEFKKWRRQRGTDSRLQFRAGLILDCARGLSVRQIAQRYQISERTVSRWRRRFADERLAGLVVIRASGVRENARKSEGRKAVAGKIGRAKVALADVGKAVAKKAADVGGMIGDAGVAGAKNAVKVPGMIADARVSVAKKAGDVGDAVAGAGHAITKKAVNIGEVAVNAGITGAKRAADVGVVVVDTGHAGAKIVLSAAIFGAQAMQVGFRRTLDATVPVADWLSATAQGLLASSLADDLNGLLQSIVKGTPTIYDKAMDAEYIATSIGGGLHRLFDGGHTIYGAFKAAHGASTEDSLLQEFFGSILGLFRDVTTPGGLPLGRHRPQGRWLRSTGTA